MDNKGFCGSKSDINGQNRECKVSETTQEDHTVSFEDALNIVGHGSYNRRLLMVLIVILLASGVDMFGNAVLVFACSCDLQLTQQQKAILNSVPFAGPIFMSYAWGYLADTRGRQKTLVYGLGGGAVMALISCFSPNWIFLAVTKLISISLSSCAQSTTYTLIGESCVQKKRGTYMMLLTSALLCCQSIFFGLSYVILPLDFSYDMGVLGRFLPWRLLALVMTVPLVVGFFGLLAFNESPKFLVSKGREKEALEVMKNMWIRNGGSPDMFQIKKITLDEHTPSLSCKDSFLKSLWHQTAPLFKPPLLKRTMQLFYISAITYSICNGCISWFPFFVNKFFMSLGSGDGQRLCQLLENTTVSRTNSGNNISEPCATTFEDSTVVAGVTYAFCCLAGNVFIALSPGRKKFIIIVTFLLSAASGIGLLYTWNPIATMALYIIFAAICVMIGPIFSYYVDLYPTSHRGMAACLGVVVARFSALVGTNLFGAFVMSHCDPTFYVASAFALSGVLVAVFLPPDRSLKVN